MNGIGVPEVVQVGILCVAALINAWSFQSQPPDTSLAELLAFAEGCFAGVPTPQSNCHLAQPNDSLTSF